jgi:hypothetical protein
LCWEQLRKQHTKGLKLEYKFTPLKKTAPSAFTPFLAGGVFLCRKKFVESQQCVSTFFLGQFTVREKFSKMSSGSDRVFLLEVPTDKGAEMPKSALVVKSDLTTEVLDITENELRKLQQAVDGLIQPVDLGPEITMWVNEEGLLRGDLVQNWIATGFMRELFSSRSPIMGDVVFTGGNDEEGNTLSIPTDALESLVGMASRAKEVLGA